MLMPNNCQEVRVSLPDKPLVADALGAVADAVLHGDQLPDNTLIVTEHFESKMVTAEEMSEYVSNPVHGGNCGRVWLTNIMSYESAIRH